MISSDYWKKKFKYSGVVKIGKTHISPTFENAADKNVEEESE